MPTPPPHACATPNCGALVPRGRARCDGCEEKHQAHDRATRGSARRRGYDSKWEARRLRHLQKHPLCVHCQREGIVRAATVVDHIVPHKGDRALFDDDNNLQSLCASHHSVKTGREDRGAWAATR